MPEKEVLRPAALVTGASSGIGATFARVLAAIGCDLILVARRKDRLDALAAELGEAYGVAVEPVEADLADPAALRQVEERIAAAPRLEFLINNAGFGSRGRFLELDAEAAERMHRVHITATLRLTHAALRIMVPRRAGAIINVSSVSAFAPMPGSVSYSATKAWIVAFSRSLQMELKSAGSPVRVQALCPGFTITEFHDRLDMDRSEIPECWWMSSEQVVAESFRGLSRNQLIVVPGMQYRVLVCLLRWLPQALYDYGAIAAARKRGRDMSPLAPSSPQPEVPE
ncbi:MAG: SDR family NAD(P)-dependent oxidoreductase [bacterium]